MKKVLLIVMSAYLISGCSLFKRNTKYGCPTDGRNVGAEKILSGDPKSLKAAKKAKYKGGRSAKSVY